MQPVDCYLSEDSPGPYQYRARVYVNGSWDYLRTKRGKVRRFPSLSAAHDAASRMLALIDCGSAAN